jgi:hypothetical protein
MARAPRLVAHCVSIRPTPPVPACNSTVSSGYTGYTDLISKWGVMPLMHRSNSIDLLTNDVMSGTTTHPRS